ncbi:MAG: hypothetical protein ACYS0I_13210 [Planctomycetota bacterium]
MNRNSETKRYAGFLKRGVQADKIALLVLFVITVLIAYLITVIRSRVFLSGPIKLDCAALSVSIPAGNGWQYEKQWNYQQNSFTLSSIFAPPPGGEVTLVRCRYPLAAQRQDIFEKKASEIGGSIAKTGQINTEKLNFQWVYIEKKEALLDVFFGIARLPDSRRLDIEVRQVAGDSQFTEQLFQRIIDSVTVQENKPFTAGSEIVAKIKNKGIDSFINSSLPDSSDSATSLKDQIIENFFLIKDPSKQPTGFAMEQLISSRQLEDPSIQAAGFYYLADNFQTQQKTFFQSDNNFNEFVSRSETITIKSRSRSQAALNKTGLLTVRKFGPRPEEKHYYPGPAALPDVFLEQLFSEMLDGNYKEILIDMIEADGEIKPISVSRIDNLDDVSDIDAAFVLKVELLDGRGFYDIVYFDSKKTILKRLLHQENNIFTLERTSRENISEQFPDWADFILQGLNLPRQIQ